MKKLLLFVSSALLVVSGHSQVCNFDQPDWGYTLQTTGTYSISNGSPLEPPNTFYGVAGSYALTSSGGTTTLTLDSVNTSGFPCTALSFSFGASANSGSGKGMDQSSDYLKCQYKLKDSGIWIDLLEIKGYRNALWSINNTSLSLASTANHSIQYIPEEGGVQLGQVVNQCVIDGLPEDSALTIRFILHSDRANEIWSIDNIHLAKPNHWLNSQGDFLATNPLNWSRLFVPDSASVVFVSDTAPVWNSGGVRCRRLITNSDDTLDLSNTKIILGEWAHLGGVVLSDSGLHLNNDYGSGEITLYDGEIFGDLTMQMRFPFKLGWTHLSSPLKSTWSQVLRGGSQVNYGHTTATSVFAWDPTNVSWYGLSSGSQNTSGLPVVIYTGKNWIDSSDVLNFSGTLVSSDSSALFYGVPSSSSPFPNTAGNEGWNFVGNPFPYTIDLRSFFLDSNFPVECNPTAYIWDAENGSYKSYNPFTGGMGGGMAYLPPFQAMWVQLNTDPGIPIPLIFKSEHRGMARGAEIAKKEKRMLDLQISSKDQIRRVRIEDRIGSSPMWEGKFDHYQRAKRSFEAYLTVQDDDGLFRNAALKSLDPHHKGGLILEVRAAQNELVLLSAKNSTSSWWLKEESSGTWIDLSTADYKYWSDGSTTKFTLWRSKPLEIKEEEEGESCVIPRRTNGNFIAESSERWQLIDISGKVILDFKGTAQIPVLASGIYVWRSERCVKRVVY